MKTKHIAWPGLVCWSWVACFVCAGEQPSGKGLTEQNQERLVIADMEDIAAWRTDTTAETTLSRSDKHQAGKYSLLFANKIDHTQGKKSYPIGWPRVNKDLVKAKLTDWSAYDAFECWIYAQTSAAALPHEPLGIGFSFAGKKHSSGFPLTQLRKDQWTKIVIPIAKLADPHDVRRVQFHLAEANYKHGDRVDFYINDVVLTRYIDPAVNSFSPRRQVVYGNEKHLEADFTLVGRQGLQQTTVEFSIGQGNDPPLAKTTAKAARSGEVVLAVPAPLTAPQHWARLDLRDPSGKLLDRRQVEFRVVPGPF